MKHAASRLAAASVISLGLPAIILFLCGHPAIVSAEHLSSSPYPAVAVTTSVPSTINTAQSSGWEFKAARQNTEILSLITTSMPKGVAKVAATTRYVSKNDGSDTSNNCTTNAAPCQTIQHAVDQSVPGDAVLVAGGIYTGVMNHAGVLVLVYISMTLSMQGGYTTTDAFSISDPLANPTIVDGGQSGRVIFFFGANGDISNLTVQNGVAPGKGAGIYSFAVNALTLTQVTVISNTASDSGGGIAADGRLVMRDVSVVGNKAVTSGGGAFVEAGSVAGAAIVDRGVFHNNGVTGNSDSGGGLNVIGSLTLSGTQFLSNTVSNGPGTKGGGAVYLSTGAGTITGALFQNNNAGNGLGGGLLADSPMMMSGVTFAANAAYAGGGAALSAGGRFDGGLFQNNIGTGDSGGGLYTFGDTVLTGTRFLSNSASLQGGGLYTGGTLMMTGTRFLGNTASQGGGAYLYHFNSSSTGRVVNTLFARNSALSGQGAALFLNVPGRVDILFSTIASPTLTGGSAIQVANGTVGITDTIVASHTIGINRTGGSVFEDYNVLFGNTSPLSGTVGSGGHSLGGDPRFIAPAVDDYHLQPGSTAIDTGVNGGVASDLDGSPRPRGLGFDIGAYEAAFTGTVVFLPLVRK